MKPEDILAVHPRIRFVGLATRKGQVIFGQMRPGVVSHHKEPSRTAGLELQGPYVIEMAEKKYWAGPLEHVAMTFEKYVQLFIPLKNHIAEITIERDVPPEMYSKICSAIRDLEK